MSRVFHFEANQDLVRFLLNVQHTKDDYQIVMDDRNIGTVKEAVAMLDFILYEINAKEETDKEHVIAITSSKCQPCVNLKRRMNWKKADQQGITFHEDIENSMHVLCYTTSTFQVSDSMESFLDQDITGFPTLLKYENGKWVKTNVDKLSKKQF